MKSIIALTFFLSLSLAAPQSVGPCACTSPICPLELIAECKCKNAAALACWEQYSTQGIACASPTPTPCGVVARDTVISSIPPTATACVCEQKACAQIWPESCYCENAIKKDCFDKCGGVEPVYQSCPALNAREVPTLTPYPVPTSTSASVPSTTTHPRCGGLRGTTCPAGYVCIDDPSNTSCGIACDEPGICVSDKPCSGFLGAACPKGQRCVDDPRDSCDPAEGGADCVGLCV
ncbi:hypothetical protein AOQ84DRAFT_322471 [Glonium stellatum]|uniref:Uncharacterized protein n=1 Tax=Glonium stellatum TaxID=574774 RepID=A0A8E2EWA4_9PEZI|nr:hypothetical protein AOQ84DRAFT_322471 [Glonium stellatum]